MLDVRKIRLILELRESGISNSNVLSALELIPREKFIPEKSSHRYIYSASCHNRREINLSNAKLFDFILISPVLSSCYGTSPLGWTSFSDLSHESFMPTLALGGVCSLGNDLSVSINNNGFGLAGIKLI